MDASITNGSKDRPYDVLIIGAGVIGSAAAVTFATQGRSVLLLERRLKEPDRIVGELLQPGGVAALDKLGLGGCLDGIDVVPVEGYEIFYRGESMTFFYPPVKVSGALESSQNRRQNWEPDVMAMPQKVSTMRRKRPEGRSFHHGKFVMKLRKAAMSKSSVKVVESTANELLVHEEKVVGVNAHRGAVGSKVYVIPPQLLLTWSILVLARVRLVSTGYTQVRFSSNLNASLSSTHDYAVYFFAEIYGDLSRFIISRSGILCELFRSNTSKFYAQIVVAADGQGSNFRSRGHNCRPVSRSRFWGLELIDAELPKYARAYGVIGSGPPVLIYQIGAHETRILIDIPDNIYSAASAHGGVKDYIKSSVIPILPKSVQPAVENSLKEGRLRSMPNSWLPADLKPIAGLLILGDAMNIRHPLTGGGMTVGLKDVVLVSRLLDQQTLPSFRDTELVLKQTMAFYSQRKTHSMSLNVLAQALYTLFLADGMFLPFF